MMWCFCLFLLYKLAQETLPPLGHGERGQGTGWQGWLAGLGWVAGLGWAGLAGLGWVGLAGLAGGWCGVWWLVVGGWWVVAGYGWWLCEAVDRFRYIYMYGRCTDATSRFSGELPHKSTHKTC